MKNIENLGKWGGRREHLSGRALKAQIEAVKNLVSAAHDQLAANRINRDAGWNVPDEACRFDAFLRLPSGQGVFKITSVGLLDEKEAHGLFIEVHVKDQEGRPDELLSLQTAKVADVVGEQEALWLSGFRPSQLDLLTAYIRQAKPIDKTEYEQFFGRSPSAISF